MSRLENLKELPTFPVDLSEVTETQDRDVKIDLARYSQVILDGPMPKVHFEVEAISANYKLKNLDIRVQADRPHRVQEKNVIAFVRIPPDQMGKWDRRKVYGVVDLKGMTKGEHAVPIQVVLPSGVTLVRVVPDRLTVTLE